MVFSVSPAVIVKEIDATATVPAVSTAPAAIAGVFRWGPVNERVLVTSENELVSIFGKPTDLNAETFFVSADYLAYASPLYVTRVIDGAVKATSTYFEAKYHGVLGNALEVAYVTNATAYSTVLGAIGAIDGTITFNSTTLTLVSTNNFSTTLEVGDIIRIGNETVGYQNIKVTTFSFVVNAGEYTYTIGLASRYSLSELDASLLSFTRLWGMSDSVGAAPKTGMMHIVVSDKTGLITGVAGTVLEIYENVSDSATAKLEDGTSNFYKNVIEARSNWIAAVTAQSLLTTATLSDYTTLTGGSDGQSESAVSFGKIAQGYDLYRDGSEVDIAFVLQGKANANANLANYIVANIAERRKDCVAFLSPRLADVVGVASEQEKLTNIITYRNQVQNSSYWFMDSGYKRRYDKYNDVYRWVPLNGDVAGLAARVDPWESPAGYTRGLLKNVVSLAFNPKKEFRDQLWSADVNPVMTQTGQGTVLFGDKTGLGASSAFNALNVRRLFITVEKAIATASARFLFDFNDEFTQSQFKNLVEPFLRDIQGRRGIIDFRVVSDSSINTPDVVDMNIFRGNIFIKPARVIREIQLNFIATRTGVEFDEIIGQFQ